ncbi:MAG: DUF362 domain-containing protein [Anaerolineales bacterium]|nr:DUF362 domain-containing protein [Anaerolineales bacterium]
MPSKVFYGSARQALLEARETLPAKLDLILEQLNLRERVKNERVVIKMHTANNIGYSTIHPVFVRKVVQAIKDGGGKPFVADVPWDAAGAEMRGYSSEVLGCPVYPTSGPDEKYSYAHKRPYKNIQEWHVAGMIEDASFLVDFAHVKGHPTCGFGGALKNIALGCMASATRGQMHDTMHYDPYWEPEKCSDPEKIKAIAAACPFEAIVEDHKLPGHMHLHIEQCNQCRRCLKVAPKGSLKIQAVNFHTFMEACAIAVSEVLSTFEAAKVVHLSLASFMTPLCDCFGFTTMPILPDAGIFGSDDIVAIDQAALDIIARTPLIEENIPLAMEIHFRDGHPFRQLFGPYKDPYVMTEYAEKYGLGCRDYELVDVFPLVKPERAALPYTSST